MAALADDGIPGGPGIYSTRCPPLPRLRMKESREAVHRATLKARGIEPDAAATGSQKGSRPASQSSSQKGTTGDAAYAADSFGELDLGPLPKLNRLGGGGGGDFSSGVGADRYLKVSYEAKKLRETRKRELAKAGYPPNGSPVKPGAAAVAGAGGGKGGAANNDDGESVISMSDDRAAEAAAQWAKAREEQTALLHQATQAYNTVANQRRVREAALAKLELELDHLAATGLADFSDLEERVEKLKVDYTAQLEQSEEEAERKQPIYLQIASRLREGNLELKQGVESLKDVLKDFQADHDSCKEYERAALEAQKKGGEALEWIQQRYIAKVEGWRTELEKTRLERERLAEDVKNERAEDRDFKKRQELIALEMEAKNSSLKRIAAGMMHDVEEKEMVEEVSRGALSQLAVTVGLDNPESCTPDEIVAALSKSRESKEKFAEQISDLQEKEAELWKKIMREKDSLQQARLGLSQRMHARMSQAGGPRAVALAETEIDLATTRESYMDELLLGKEKVLMSMFRNFNNAMVVLATFDEGLRSINDMVDVVMEAPRRKKAASRPSASSQRGATATATATATAATATESKAGGEKQSLSRSSSVRGRDGASEPLTLNRKTQHSVSFASSTEHASAGASEHNSAASVADDASVGGREDGAKVMSLASLFAQSGARKGASDMMAYYARLPELADATMTRLLDIMRYLPREGRAARVSVTLGTTSVAKGGKGISIDHPLAGVGHKLGKVTSALSEVDTDPAGMNDKKGKDYMEQLKKWCYVAGAPVDSDDEDGDGAAGEAGGKIGGSLETIGRVNAKLSTVSQFKRIGGRSRNGDPDAPAHVVKRGDLKQESRRAKAQNDKAKSPFAALPVVDSLPPAEKDA